MRHEPIEFGEGIGDHQDLGNLQVRRLMTLPGIGPIPATAFVPALDDVARYRGPG